MHDQITPVGRVPTTCCVFPLIPFQMLAFSLHCHIFLPPALEAQQRNQSIQDVPIAVSAFDQECLNDAGLDAVLGVYLTARTLLNQ